MHHSVLSLHEKYGPVVRLGPSELSFIDAAAWKDIYGLARQKEIERCHASFPALTPNDGKFDLLTSHRIEHAKYRKMLNPSFSEKSVAGYEPALMRNADNFISKLKAAAKVSDRINITKWFQWVAFDIVGDVVWGTPFDCIDEERNHPCLALSMDLVALASLVVLVARFNSLKIFLIKLVGVEGKFVDMVRSKCTVNRESKGEKSDAEMGDVFSNLTKDGDVMSQIELDGNLTALVVAGSETTGFTMTATSFYLAKNPEWFHKVAEEVRSSFAAEEDITGDALKKLPILKACIEEALRMSPAAPNGLAREVVSDGLDIQGHFVPKGVCPFRSPLMF